MIFAAPGCVVMVTLPRCICIVSSFDGTQRSDAVYALDAVRGETCGAHPGWCAPDI